MILGFIVMLATGYTATSVVTSCPAQAQCVCGICVYITSGIIVVVSEIMSGIVIPAIEAAAGLIITYMGLAFTAFVEQVAGKWSTVADNFVGWFDAMYFYNLLPAMQQQTRQLNVADADQTRTLTGFTDSADQSRVQKDLAINEARARAETQPGENVCVAGTIVGGMTKATALARAYNAAAPVERLARSGGALGTPAASGPAADQSDRWQTYVERYCNVEDNAGAAGCTANGTHVGQDIDVTGQIFEKDTILLTDPEVKRTIDDLIINIGEPFTFEHVNPAAVDSAGGRETVLTGESYKAKRQAVFDALYHVTSRRAPGSNMQEFLRPMREAAGVNAADISENPSKNEVMQVMMSERFQTGTYSISQIDEPHNNDREIVIQEAFQLMQLSDKLDLLDRYAFVLAAEAGDEIQGARPLQTAPDQQPQD